MNYILFIIYMESSKLFRILPKSLHDLTGNEINMMGGLFKAPIRI